jgi:eukaryotic-like serine/threonine-protein kinase
VERTKQWEKIKELFDVALGCEPSERDAFLREACGQDETVRAEVNSLLEAHAHSDALSEHPWSGQRLDEAQAFKSIGPYRLIKKIGEGGMGQVWLAEQTAPLRRQVALKLIRAGMYDDALLHRFQAERQSLAIMDHPAIAKVFDAGATPEGQPYFVMEYVPGEPITEYCDRKKLGIRERLELFIKACEGVQHAHQKAIIHRDLKPANILVVELDGKPVPRIIDFGLAKAAAALVPGETLVTRAGGLVGTPGYMSPEQADPGVKDVDTRTDVYSLGVILYVLLTGYQPFDTSEWEKKPLHEVMQKLRDHEAPRPSTKVEREKESSTAAAELRGTQPKQLAGLLHGDLDWITMKALEKDRARRYETPSELASDIERYLKNEPVVARPASAGYRLRKYVRRHRIAVGVAAALVILLAGFAVVEAVQLRRITQERDRESRITDFMIGMFKVSDPSEARGNTVTAREILDKASKDIDPGLAKDPELQAQMMYVMGKVYDSLGLYSTAESLLQRSVDIRKRMLGPENRDTLNSMLALALALDHRGHYSDAEALQRQALAIRRRTLGPNHPDTATAMGNLGVVLYHEGHFAESEAQQRETLDIRRRTIGPEKQDALATMSNLALDLEKEARYQEAEALDQQALEMQRRTLGPDHPDTLFSMANLANVLYREGRYADAEKLRRETLDIDRRVFGPEHPATLMSMSNLIGVLSEEGKYDEATRLARETVEIRRRVLGPEHPATLISMGNLAEALTLQGQYTEAEKLLTETLDTQRRVLPRDDPNAAINAYNLAGLELKLSRREQSFLLLRESIDHGLPMWVLRGIEHDPDFNSLHGDARFDALVAHAKERAGASQSAK